MIQIRPRTFSPLEMLSKQFKEDFFLKMSTWKLNKSNLRVTTNQKQCNFNTALPTIFCIKCPSKPKIEMPSCFQDLLSNLQSLHLKLIWKMMMFYSELKTKIAHLLTFKQIFLPDNELQYLKTTYEMKTCLDV